MYYELCHSCSALVKCAGTLRKQVVKNSIHSGRKTTTICMVMDEDCKLQNGYINFFSPQNIALVRRMNVLWSYSIAERMADVAVGRKALHQSIVEPSPNTPEEFFFNNLGWQPAKVLYGRKTTCYSNFFFPIAHFKYASFMLFYSPP